MPEKWGAWFCKELFAAFGRLRKRDPFTYWCTLIGLLSGIASLILHAFK